MGICCSQTPGNLRSDGNEIVNSDLAKDMVAIESAGQKQRAAECSRDVQEEETPADKEYFVQAPNIKSHNEETNVNGGTISRR